MSNNNCCYTFNPSYDANQLSYNKRGILAVTVITLFCVQLGSLRTSSEQENRRASLSNWCTVSTTASYHMMNTVVYVALTPGERTAGGTTVADSIQYTTHFTTTPGWGAVVIVHYRQPPPLHHAPLKVSVMSYRHCTSNNDRTIFTYYYLKNEPK